MDGGVDGWMDGWMDVSTVECNDLWLGIWKRFKVIPIFYKIPLNPAYKHRKFLPVMSHSSFCCFELTERRVHYRNVLCLKTSKARTCLEHKPRDYSRILGYFMIVSISVVINAYNSWATHSKNMQRKFGLFSLETWTLASLAFALECTKLYGLDFSLLNV